MENFTLRRNVLASAILAAAAAATPQTLIAAEEGALEEVTVVGSRISRNSEFENATPVQVMDRETIEKSGYTNLQQLFEKNPAAGNGTFSTRGNNQDSTANGAAAVSLRGMGADATLVLVNGKRVAISSFAENIGTNFVDINSIPLAAVERVEILKDGASAIYGSDAIAGVVNLVLRKDFEDAEVSMDYGSADGYDEQSFSAVWGVNGENSNVTVILDHHKNTRLSSSERGLDNPNLASRGGNNNWSSRGFPGSFVLESGDGSVPDPSCPEEYDNGKTCLYDYGPWTLITPEAERTGLLMLSHTDLTDNLEFFSEIAVQHNTSVAQGAPTPLDETAGLYVLADHPNNPFGEYVDIYRFRTVDAGARQWEIQTDNLRGVFGLRGSITEWDWEASVQRSRSESKQTGSKSQGWVRTDLLQEQINAGNYNPFDGMENPESVIDAITTSLVRQGKSEFTGYDFSINGDLFETSNGTVAMATGLEYREEKISDIPDDQFQRGLIFGTESVYAKASRDITSAFVEFAIPLPADIELSLAGRYDDYSDFGSSTNPMASLLWPVNEMLTLRTSWGTGFRAPSLAQVGLGPSQKSVFLDDDDTYGCAVNETYCSSTDYTIVFTGNPDLEPEESESFNIGAVLEPLEGLQLSLDYWNITQENKIEDQPAQHLYDKFCDSQDSVICNRADPLRPEDTLGPIQEIYGTYLNIGEQDVSGIDFTAVYSGLALAGGELGLRLDYSYLVEFDRIGLGSSEDPINEDLAGEYEYPQHRWTTTADWSMDNFGLSAGINYIGEFEDVPDHGASRTDRTVDSFMTVNFQARYTGFNNMVLSLGAENLFDEEPPFAIGDGADDLYGYVQSQHDPRGRFIYGKMTYTF